VTPAMDRRSAARILDLAEPRGSRRLAVAAFAGLLAIAAHVAAGEGFPFVAPTAGSSPARAEHLVAEHAHMKRLMAVGAVAAMASSGVLAQDAVQWRVEDGGNGHWYRFVPIVMPWSAARSTAIAAGGDLACLTSAPENNFARSILLPQEIAVGYMGAYRDAQGWHWVSGEPWAFTNWNPGEPNGESGEVAWLQNVPGYANGWNDHPPEVDVQGSIWEWSADCNADGIVDFGQIRAGELADANGNNIPDCCEQGVSCIACPGDIDENSGVDGVDLAIILTRWGQIPKDYPRADANGDGTVNGSDLTIVLNAWGACP